MGRRLGQHFLHDRGCVERILTAAALEPADRVLEIGPGQGILTRPLAERVSRLIAVELDGELAHALAGLPGLEVKQADILEVDLGELLEPPGWKVIANLPYYITTPILERLICLPAGLITGMWLMMQHEVADRIVSPATRRAGALSYFVGLYCQADYLFKVPPGAFSPPPKVDSAVIRLTPWAEGPRSARPLACSRLVRMAFSQRRKMLRRSLGQLSEAVFEAAGIDSARRPETLTLEEFVALEEAAFQAENRQR